MVWALASGGHAALLCAVRCAMHLGADCGAAAATQPPALAQGTLLPLAPAQSLLPAFAFMLHNRMG